ncbi:MAG: hypothetical protein Q9228_002944, partial [Teloschistes exilis]
APDNNDIILGYPHEYKDHQRNSIKKLCMDFELGTRIGNRPRETKKDPMVSMILSLMVTVKATGWEDNVPCSTFRIAFCVRSASEHNPYPAALVVLCILTATSSSLHIDA